MADPSPNVKKEDLVPHADDEVEVHAGLEDKKRGDVLSKEESEAYVRKLLGDEQTDP